MSISGLIRTIEKYDEYGLHRLNGLKVVYCFFALMVFNGMFDITHPYFYYFYLPITALSAEVMKETVLEKYHAFLYTILWSAIAALVFNMSRPYPLFFLFFAFLTTVYLYKLALNRVQMMIPLVPVVLSLAAYSLVYPSISMNLRMMLFNLLNLVAATGVILAALILFPLSYYYRLWLKAFRLTLIEIIHQLDAQQKSANQYPVIQKHIKHMRLFTQLLPKSMPTYSILNITILIHELYLKAYSGCKVTPGVLDNLKLLVSHIEQETPCLIYEQETTHLKKMIQSWNTLCMKQ